MGLFAVNLDTYESDLTYLDDPLSDESVKDRTIRVVAELQSRLGQPPLVSYVDDPSTLADALGGGRRSLKLWDILLVFVLLIGLFEPWLANQISRRLYGRPSNTSVAIGPRANAPRPTVETAGKLTEGVAR